MTLNQSLDTFIGNITITDKQTTNISTSYNNLQRILVNGSNGLNAIKIFQQGSYDRDTIIRPLDDVDIFLVLNKSYYTSGWSLEKSQVVLTKVRNFMNNQHDYKGKVKQDRPCVTITLADKHIDILPCFGDDYSGYQIPARDLTGWITTNPVKHSEELTRVNRNSSGNVVPVIRAVKHWNRENGKVIPSYHIEEVAIRLFNFNRINNKVEGVYQWFANGSSYLSSSEFKSYEEYNKAVNMVRNASTKISHGYQQYRYGQQESAVASFKSVFGSNFPS